MMILGLLSGCPNCSWWLLPLLLGAMLLGYLWWRWTSGSRLKTQINSLSSDINNWRAKFKTQNEKLAEVEYDKEKLSGEYATLHSKMSDSNAKYLALENKYDLAISSESVDTSDYTNRIAELESQLSVVGAEDTSALRNRIEDLESQLREASALAGMSDDSEAQSRIGELESKLEISRNTNLKLQDDYSSLKTKFGDLETKVSGGDFALGAVSEGGEADSKIRIDDLEKKLAIAYENNAKLEADYAGLKADYGNLKMENQSSDVSGEMASQLENYQLRIAELESQLSIPIPLVSSSANADNKKKKKKKKTKEKGKKKKDVIVKSSSSGVNSGYGLAFGEDNLQIIEGIGPKIEGLLKGAGINTWSELANTDEIHLKDILAGGGSRYKMHDPSSWSNQAELAQTGNWSELVNLQKGLGGTGSNMTDAKVEKLYAKAMGFKSFKPDDLKVIEGIGPKIEGLLKDAGFTTWKKLSNSKVSALQKVLDEAGPRYKLANPGTWAKQAKLAEDGDWGALKAYQDELDGGKE